jgi:polar amino acid transport system substrate-binding protein
MQKIFSILASILLLLSACGKNEGPLYRIGIDPTWYSLDLKGKEKNLLGFSTELLKEISEIEKINIELITRSWDNLVQGLEEKNYEGILSTIRPYLFNLKKYDFSAVYLATGPVLILSTASHFTSIEEMKGKEVGMLRGSQDEIFLKQYPTILTRTFDSIPEMLTAVAKGNIDGALVNVLTARAYIQDLYHGQLKIVTPPLDNEGLRLITLHDQVPALIKKFNEGLEKAKEKGIYKQLAQKWALNLSQ